MSEIKIPNCPCCDGKSKLHDYGGGDFRDGGKQYFIKCEKCGLTTKHSSSKDEVLMNWGKRKPMERIVERLEELISKNQDISRANYIKGYLNGLKVARTIVKEEGGIDG